MTPQLSKTTLDELINPQTVDKYRIRINNLVNDIALELFERSIPEYESVISRLELTHGIDPNTGTKENSGSLSKAGYELISENSELGEAIITITEIIEFDLDESEDNKDRINSLLENFIHSKSNQIDFVTRFEKYRVQLEK